MKIKFALLTSLAFVFFSHFSSAQVKPLSVSGTKLVNYNGEVVVLRGMSMGWHNWWGKYFNSNVVSQLVNDWHCDVIRAAIGVAESHDIITNPDYGYACLDTVVNSCIKQNAYVIIDWHSHKTKTAEAAAFFARNAKLYGKYPNIIYELFNEPTSQSWCDLKAYYKVLCDSIRKYDKSNVILLGCPNWDQRIDLPADDPFTGFTNIMYTVHFYAGTHKDDLRNLTEDCIKKGVPVFISECGSMNADGKGPSDIQSLTAWINLADKYSLSMCFWSVSDKRETCSVFKPGTSPYKTFTDKDLKPTGFLYKKYLITRKTDF